MKKIENTHYMCYYVDMECKQEMTRSVTEQVNYRIKKKRGLLRTQEEQKLKEWLCREIEEEAAVLERLAEHGTAAESSCADKSNS